MCSIWHLRFYPDVAMQLLISENAESSVFFPTRIRPETKEEVWSEDVLNVFVKILPAIHLIVFSREANPILSRATSFPEAACYNSLCLCLDLFTKLSEVKMDLSPKTFWICFLKHLR